jgi:hypothetical protein
MNNVILHPDWDETREWPTKYVDDLLRTIRADWREGRVSIDFFDKLKDRGIYPHEVTHMLTSPETYVARFWHKGGNRVGLWNPKTRLLVVWKPLKGKSPSRLMTCFRRSDGIAYMQARPPFREIRGPRRARKR